MFPQWSLWGMGLATLGALLAMGLALVVQSPRAVARLGWENRRPELRLQALTGYAVAFLILALGFFGAGVPLDEEIMNNPEIVTVVITATPDFTVQLPVQSPTPNVTPVPVTPNTGAFVLPATATATILITVASTDAPEPTRIESIPTEAVSMTPTIIPTNNPTPTASSTPTPTSSPTPTASPTFTPSPTPTPTPIIGETATINTGGSTLWVRQTPGGIPITLIQHRDVVILLDRHANQGGELWREIQTTSGFIGWVKAEFLVMDES